MSKIFRTKSKNTVISGGRELVVEDFSFDWPRASKEVDRLAITLSDILHPTKVLDPESR